MGDPVRRHVEINSTVRAWKLRNVPHRLRGLKEEAALRLLRPAGFPVMLSQLEVLVTRADGTVEEYGVVSRRVVTNAGVQFIVASFLGTATASDMNYHGSGSGTAPATVTDTALETPTVGVGRATGTKTNPATGAYRTTGTITYNGPFQITEHAPFSDPTAGSMLDRTVFAAIPVNSGDAITFTYTITFQAGG